MDILEKKKIIDKLINSNFKIIVKLESFLDELDGLLSNVPRSDYFYKDKIRSDSYLLLEYIYFVNYTDDIDERKEYLKYMLTKISVIDRLLGRLYLYSYINEKQLIKSISLFNEITKMINSWVNNVK